jgi:hypothetical protein
MSSVVISWNDFCKQFLHRLGDNSAAAKATLVGDPSGVSMASSHIKKGEVEPLIISSQIKKGEVEPLVISETMRNFIILHNFEMTISTYDHIC